MEWTPEQQRILEHPTDCHGHLLAGPGTGKSTTVLALAQRITEVSEEASVRLATFTRTATAELVGKVAEVETEIAVTTVHGLALRILLANAQWPSLPQPLRLPDDWELDELIHEDLAERLRVVQPGLRKGLVKKLEREMGSRWESLDEDVPLIVDLAPHLRAAYTSAWRHQRQVFGYSLFPEMPLYALQLIEDHDDADLLNLQTLIVDEYQDLNACEIELVRALADRGVWILAVGDDDQSIYSWRMAAPAGIRNVPSRLSPVRTYTLSVSQRCGRAILDAAQRLIATAPGRSPERPPLRPGEQNSPGLFRYLRFQRAEDERAAVCSLLQRFAERVGIPFERMAVLMRSDYQQRWSGPLRSAMADAGLPVADVEAALAPLLSDSVREFLALARLSDNAQDHLSWWALLHLEDRIPMACVQRLADFAFQERIKFSEALHRMAEGASIEGLATVTRNRACDVYRRTIERLTGVEPSWPPPNGVSWSSHLSDLAAEFEASLSEELLSLVDDVESSDAAPTAGSVEGLIGQLGVAARDAALEASGVAVMTAARSKGLTFDAVVTVGVEQELFPSPLSMDPEEDRRLLYVAITRARRASILTMARYRNDGTAHSGSGDAVRSRARCEFLSLAGIYPEDGPTYLADPGW